MSAQREQGQGPRPPALVRKLEAQLLMRAFARAFDVEPPALAPLSADEALRMYREFTAACMEMACKDDRLAARLRTRLGNEALALGRLVRAVPGVQSHALACARYLYRGIGISLTEDEPGTLRFGPCLFSERYNPQTCWFMSAFDEGFLRGLTGNETCRLAFSCRLTEGASCCLSQFA